MAVVIRMQRVGKKNRPHYRFAVVDSRFERDGRFLELVGHYDPLRKGEPAIAMDVERIRHWRSQGAKLSDRAAAFLKRFQKAQASAAATAETPSKAVKKQ